MTFEELPPNWSTLPLSTPRLAADVVDLVLSESLRTQNTMLLLPCDEHDVPYPAPVVLSGTDWSAHGEERREMLKALATIGVSSAVVAASSAHQLPADVISRWHADAEVAFSSVNTRLIGFFSVWSHSVEKVTAPEPPRAFHDS